MFQVPSEDGDYVNFPIKIEKQMKKNEPPSPTR